MKISLCFILVCLICQVQSFQGINSRFQSVLNGNQPLTSAILKDIYYNHFTSNFPKTIFRHKIFEKNLHEIITHNLQNTSWQKGINQFSDMTWLEFQGTYLMAPQKCSATFNTLKVQKIVSYPASFEWNNYGVVTSVKTQGQCGAGWAFSSTGAIEAHWRILGKGKTELFSEQQLIDCSEDHNNFGCFGGLPSQAFQYIKDAGGLQTTNTYPYSNTLGKCKFNITRAVVKVPYGSYNITPGNQDELADRLSNVGPISIGFSVIAGFSSYYSGIYVPPEGRCGTKPEDINHLVLATGYGQENGVPFWNVKNSWGPTWGNSGYFKIIRGKNACAISQCNSYPLMSHPSSK